jgi:CDP-2,3-bis-(O-geranylgeranyl)-sn-glycerol synthase
MFIEYLSSLDETLAPPLRALLLLVVANSAPVLGRKLLGQRLGYPLDGGLRIFDGRPLFGPSKTLRGIVLSLAATAVAALALRLPGVTGALVAGLSMLGDLTSSFIKRRLGRAPSSSVVLLDQAPEALFPLLLYREGLSLTARDIAVVTLAFLVLDLIFSRVLYKLRLRDQPR